MSNYPATYHSSSSSAHREEDTERDSRRAEEPPHTLKVFKDFLARRKLYVKTQFVTDDNIAFIKVHVESIGEDILVYFPSRYTVPRENGSVPSVELIPYELTEQDILSIREQDEEETRENYNELQIDDLKDKDSFSDDNYKPISINSNRENQVRKSMVRYTNQLNKFKKCTEHIKYKFAILTNDVLCVINRHNETECFLVKEGRNLVQNIIDSKSDSVIPIEHELYVLIDLPSFHEKIAHVSGDLIKIHRNFYATLNRAHTKQTALAEHRFKNYQLMIARLLTEYTKNGKYLDLIASLTDSLEKSVEQEDQLIQKIKIINDQKDQPTMAKDTERSFRLSKAEKDLLQVRELKTKTTKLLHEIKARYNGFIVSFDQAITETCQNLRQIEQSITKMGVSLEKKK